MFKIVLNLKCNKSGKLQGKMASLKKKKACIFIHKIEIFSHTLIFIIQNSSAKPESNFYL